MSNWYFFSQTGKSSWKPVSVEVREQHIRDENPEFMTVLDISEVWEKGEQRPANVRYRGPLYFDWDGDSIQDVLDSVRRFMYRLEEKGFDLEQASWFLSGKKGIHCTIPLECFCNASTLKSMMAAGSPVLPTVYRMLASNEDLITDHMDLSIYSLGKGRMWRTVNHKRVLSDGRETYKVPVTAAELRALTEEIYWEVCSKPRPELKRNPPTLNNYLLIEFNRAMNTVQESMKSKTANKSKAVDFADWAVVPPTVADAFKGKGIRQGLDLNVIKLQLAIAACAVGYNDFGKEDEYIAACSEFIESRVGVAGASHQTRESIEQSMRTTFRSVVNNPCYVYYPDVFASILEPELKENMDLFGKQTLDTDREARRQQDLRDMRDRVKSDEMGVIELGKEEQRSISNFSWKKGSLMTIKSETGLIKAYSVIPLIAGDERPRTVIPVETHMDQKKMTKLIMQLGGHLEACTPKMYSQIQQSWLQFVRQNLSECDEALATPLEGIYCQLVHDPEDGLKDCLNMYWVSPSEVKVSQSNYHLSTDGKPLPTPIYVEEANTSGRFGVDLDKTPYTLETTKSPIHITVESLLELNGNAFAMSAMLGWFTACLLKHPLFMMKLIKNFPIMQVYGDAGCGKTTTMNIMLSMFTWKTPFRVNAAGDGLTPAALRLMSSATASIPLVIDEVKAQNLGETQWMKSFRQYLQNAYTIGGQIRKAGGRGEGQHHNGMVDDPMFAPVAFMGETLETSQTSLMERIVPVGFHTSDKYGRGKYAKHLSENTRDMSIIGWSLVQEVMETDMEYLAGLYNSCSEECQEHFRVLQISDRIVENAAIAMTGFRFFESFINKWFPDRFTTKLEALRTSLLSDVIWSRRIESEAVRLVDLIAMLSNIPEGKLRAVKDEHYFIATEDHPVVGIGEFITLDVDRVYLLYREHIRTTGETPIYSSAYEMYHTLSNSNLAVENVVTDTISRGVKLNPNQMAMENIRKFKRI